MGLKIEYWDVVLQQYSTDMVKNFYESSYSHPASSLYSESVNQFLEYLTASLYLGRVASRCVGLNTLLQGECQR